MPGRTPEGGALTDLVLPAFELNGEFLAAAAMITAAHELTPAQWQVLGATLDQPRPVAEIARRIGLGLTRQSVQRVANDVVDRGWAAWLENPSHRRAKLLAPTAVGRDAVTPPWRPSSTPGPTMWGRRSAPTTCARSAR